MNTPRCGYCKIELDYLRDGTIDEGYRCHNCYWEDERIDKDSLPLVVPDYRLTDSYVICYSIVKELINKSSYYFN